MAKKSKTIEELLNDSAILFNTSDALKSVVDSICQHFTVKRKEVLKALSNAAAKYRKTSKKANRRRISIVYHKDKTIAQKPLYYIQDK